MDVESLISEVFIGPSLWNKGDKNHHNRFLLDSLWNEVAHKAQTTPNAVRSKWKTLRDKFRTTLASLPKSRSGDGQQVANYKGGKYFKSLFFLKGQFTPRNSSGNFGETLDGPILDEYDQGDNDNEVFLPNTILLVLQKMHQKKELKERRTMKINVFFKSLLPHVRTLSAFDKLEYHMKVVKITQEFMKPRHSTFSTYSSDYSYRLASANTQSATVDTRYYYDNAEKELDFAETRNSCVPAHFTNM